MKSLRDTKCKSGTKRSRRFKFLSKRIRTLYGAKNRKQVDFLHKISYGLSQEYDTVVVEDLNLKKMSESESTGLNRELRNSSLGKLISYLEYKCNHLIKVNPYNTSKKCHNCGRIHNMPLSNRTMNCDCGYIGDRDINAALNILCLGQALKENQNDFQSCIA